MRSTYSNVCVLITAALFLGGCLASAEDWVTRSGKQLRNVEVTGVTASELTVHHDGGVDHIPLVDLPIPVQERYSPAALFRQVQEQARELEALRRQLRQTVEPLNSPPPISSSRATATPGIGNNSETQEPALPIESLPPLQPAEVVQAFDLSNHYLTAPGAADQRYKGKTLVLRGAIERFEPVPFLRSYSILLRTSDRALRVLCKFSYPPDCKSVITKNDGEDLVARLESGRDDTLAKVGEVITIRGICKGRDQRVIGFGHCEQVR